MRELPAHRRSFAILELHELPTLDVAGGHGAVRIQMDDEVDEVLAPGPDQLLVQYVAGGLGVIVVVRRRVPVARLILGFELVGLLGASAYDLAAPVATDGDMQSRGRRVAADGAIGLPQRPSQAFKQCRHGVITNQKTGQDGPRPDAAVWPASDVVR